MNLRVFALWTSCLLLPCSADEQRPLEERWILAEDKKQFLSTLTPGTNDYYFYHALHLQQQGQRKAFLATMEQWMQSKDIFSGDTPRATQLTNRQYLLDYQAGDKEAVEKLLELLKLDHFDERESTEEAAKVSSTLTADRISEEAFAQALGVHTPEDLIKKSTQQKLFQSIADGTQWSKKDRDKLLEVVDRADLPGLFPLILANFKEPNPISFDDIAAGYDLSLKNLKQLAETYPQLYNNNDVVEQLIYLMSPADIAQHERQPREHILWLTRLHAFTETLPPSYNSLKAHVIYHKLRLEHLHSEAKIEDFLNYLELPKKNPTKHSVGQHQSPHTRSLVEFGEEYDDFYGCPPIISDEKFTEELLHHFLTNPDHQKRLSKFFKQEYFQRQVATANLLAGASTDQWGKQVSPTYFEKLRDRSELTISESCARVWQSDEAVSLDLQLKNMERLEVAIYALDTLSYALKAHEEIPHNINLNGIKPNIARTIDIRKSPFLRHQIQLALPELKGAGTWLVELYGNGQRSTALIHKGEIHWASSPTTKGQQLFVCDYQGSPLAKAQIYIDGKKYLTAPDGTLVLPYLSKERERSIIIHSPNKEGKGGLTLVDRFTRTQAKHKLQVATLTHPEQWLAHKETTIYFKPSLLINDLLTPHQKLKNATATLYGELDDGSIVQLASQPLKLSNAHFQPLTFTVPSRITHATLTVQAELAKSSLQTHLHLESSETIYTKPKTKETHLAHHYFYQTDAGWKLAILGLNGEPRLQQHVHLDIWHSSFKKARRLPFITDEMGIVHLGELSGIRKVEARSNYKSPSASLLLDQPAAELPLVEYYQVGDAIEVTLPTLPEFTPLNYSLVNEATRQSLFKQLNLSGNKLHLGKLPEGDYVLTIEGYQPQFFSVVKTTPHGAWKTAPGFAIENVNPQQAQIINSRIADGKLVVKVQGHNQWARLHLVASHFSAQSTAYQLDSPAAPSAQWKSFGFQPASLSNGGELSGEHQYILNRRAQSARLGNMLPRPSWHLHPWETITAESATHLLPPEESGEGRGGGSASFGKPAKPQKDDKSTIYQSAPIDFLDQPARILSNLVPDKNGTFTIDLKKLSQHQRVDIVLTQGSHASSQQLSLPESDLNIRDRRLAKSLSPNLHYRANEARAVLLKGASTQIENVVDADWKAYATLTQVLAYFSSQLGDGIFSQTSHSEWQLFKQACYWPSLSQKSRLDLIKDAGSHELFIFIKRRDPKWFAQHLSPILANKRRKDFIDHYLLDHDLSRYLKIAHFQRLNIAEKALLAHSLPAQSKVILEQLEALQIEHAPTLQQDAQLFSSLINQQFESQFEAIGNLDSTAPMRTRRFNVPPDFLALLGDGGSDGGTDPFAEPTNSESPAKTQPAKELLENSGIVFPEGSTARFDKKTSTLIVRNSVEGLDLIEILTSSLGMRNPNDFALPNYGIDDRPVISRTGTQEEYDDYAGGSDPFADPVGVGGGFMPSPPELPDLSKAYAEANYFRHSPKRGPLPLKVNRFWLDLARWEKSSPFLSPHFADCRGNLNAALLAIAFLDLPLKHNQPTVKLSENKMKVTASKPMLLYYRDTRTTPKNDQAPKLLCTQRYFHARAHFTEDAQGKLSENTVDTPLVTNREYEAELVIYNPTGTDQQVEVLQQIPQGAIRTDSGTPLDSQQDIIPPHHSRRYTIAFYFPATGSFNHYGPQIHEKGKHLLGLPTNKLEVLDTLPEEVDQSWESLAYGDDDQKTLDALSTLPLHEIGIDDLAWRLNDADFYKRAAAIARQRMISSQALATYAFIHHDTDGVRTFLSNPVNCTNQFGNYFSSPLLDTNPYSMLRFRDIEWRPLVNERIHSIKDDRRITNDAIWSEYLSLLNNLVWKEKIDTEDTLTLVYHLFLHDRHALAIKLFEQCKRSETEAKIQFDYLACYVHFCKSQPQQAKVLASQWSNVSNHDWAERFQQVIAQAKQIETAELLMSSETSSKKTSRYWSAQLAANNTLTIKHSDIDALTLNVYPIDLELLFSKNPFLEKRVTQHALVQPVESITIELDKTKQTTEFELPASYQSGNKLLSIQHGQQTWLETLQSSSLKLVTNQQQGILQTTHEDAPLPRCYVKVYIQKPNGQALFLKDGYTDLRGQFDFRSHNLQPVLNHKRYAIFIHHEKHGSLTRILDN